MKKLALFFITFISNVSFLFAQSMVAPGYTLYQFDTQPRPIGMAFESSGDLYVSDFQAPTRAIYQINSINGVYVSESVVASGNSAEFKPQYLAVDASDNIYFTKSNSNDGGIYTLSPSGVINMIYTPSGMDLKDPRGVAFNSSGDLFVACNNYGAAGGAYIAKFELNSSNQVVAQDLDFIGPFDNLMDLQFDDVGNLYAAGGESLIKIEFDSNGAVASIDPYFCILPASFPSDFFVAGIAIDPDGDMLVSQVNKFNPDSGKIFKVDNSGGYFLFAEGFNQPRDLVFAQDNRLYVSDSEGGRIYVIECNDQGRLFAERTFCDQVLSVSEVETRANSLSVYPNPSNGQFDILLDESTAIDEVQIINALGEVVEVSKVSVARSVHIDISDQSAGVYFVVGVDLGEVVSRSTLIIH